MTTPPIASPGSDTRRLVTIETLTRVEPIPGADAIEAAQVRGWTVVVGKGQFAPGDRVVYIEVDAALPLDDPRFAFLGERSTRQFAGRAVHVLKTARLRGVYSQGIVFALADFPELADAPAGADLDALVSVTKFEPPPPSGMAALGPFPGFLQKTDAERVQNLDEAAWEFIQGQRGAWLPTEKVDGSSLTAWRTADGVLHIAGRNWELDPDKAGAHGVAVTRHELSEHLEPGQWLQAEVAGIGVQGNPLQLPVTRLVAFGLGTFDAAAPAIATTARTPRHQWPGWAAQIAAPVCDLELPATITEAIDQVERLKSLVSPGRDAEGVVWTHADGTAIPGLDGRAVWKSISARYLTKHGG